MRSISIGDLRKRPAAVIDDVQASDEPLVVLRRSRPVAYLVRPERYQREQAELRTLRRTVFLSEVQEVEGEYLAGEARNFDDVEQLLSELQP